MQVCGLCARACDDRAFLFPSVEVRLAALERLGSEVDARHLSRDQRGALVARALGDRHPEVRAVGREAGRGESTRLANARSSPRCNRCLGRCCMPRSPISISHNRPWLELICRAPRV